ncbi:MAG: hypothetical protein KJP07_00085 [Desulfatitalea sp.]|nr:hypothetical protein [Desulfatitalea sp.]
MHCSTKRRGNHGKENHFLFIVGNPAKLALTRSPALAEEFSLNGRPLYLFGYVTQGTSYGLTEAYDTESGFNSALMNLFAEGDYQIADDLGFYASSMLTVDWMYQLKESDDSWNAKLFSESKSNLNVDDEYWQILKEARLTWTPANFMFRVGKQIVSWGELSLLRIMDQINPLDMRRGNADIEFENTVIPIWLVRADYYPKVTVGWLQDLGFEFIFNPNADFIPDQFFPSGNDDAGIWAPNITFSGARVGKTHMALDTPETWSEGHEFGVRAKANMLNTITTLNFFHGYENTPVMKPTFPFIGYPPGMGSDGSPIIPLYMAGEYPKLTYGGLTVSKELIPLKASFLGNVAPTLYLEALYAFDSTFVFSDPANPFGGEFGESDELRSGAELYWKVKIPVLNPRTYFNLSGTFFWRRIMDYPAEKPIQGLKEDNCSTLLVISTSYLHNKLSPVFNWSHDYNANADFFLMQVSYDLDYQWQFTLGGQFFNGQKEGQGYQLFDNKNQIYFKIDYRWG